MRKRSWKHSSESTSRSRWTKLTRSEIQRDESGAAHCPLHLCFLFLSCVLWETKFSVCGLLLSTKTILSVIWGDTEKTNTIYLSYYTLEHRILWCPWSLKHYVWEYIWLILRGEGLSYNIIQFSCYLPEGTVTSYRLSPTKLSPTSDN